MRHDAIGGCRWPFADVCVRSLLVDAVCSCLRMRQDAAGGCMCYCVRDRQML